MAGGPNHTDVQQKKYIYIYVCIYIYIRIMCQSFVDCSIRLKKLIKQHFVFLELYD